MLYEMKPVEIEGSDGFLAAHNPNGDYIGDEGTAEFLCKERGIAPELAHPKNNVCSIGFCEGEQKWYGWSHRAIYGFGIGSKVTKADSGYVPIDMEDCRQQAIRFWDEEYHENTTAVVSTDEDGKPCIDVTWRYTDDVPNEKIRGTLGGTTYYPPETFGRGEWTAETLDDAQQMAIDFAESVS